MEPLIIGVIVAAALACPVLMCGPMLIRRFGIIKGGSTDTSCMGMMSSRRPGQAQQLRDLTAKREEIEREIARIESATSAGVPREQTQPPPGGPQSTNA